MMDSLDKAIITELEKSGRRSYVDLAKSVGFSETTIRYRVKRLLDTGILKILGVPNLKMLGYSFVAMVGLQVRLADFTMAVDQLVKHPNVRHLAYVTGRYDFIALILTRSSDEFSHFMENVISVMPSIVRAETFVHLRIYKGKVIGPDSGQLISCKSSVSPHMPSSRVPR